MRKKSQLLYPKALDKENEDSIYVGPYSGWDICLTEAGEDVQNLKIEDLACS